MFESRKKPLLSKGKFYNRVAKNIAFAFAIIAFSLLAGTLGYRHFGSLEWIDAFYNASMILTGMGPVDPLPDEGKIFASVFALYGGFVVLSVFAIIVAPLVHRFMHKFHFDDDNN